MQDNADLVKLEVPQQNAQDPWPAVESRMAAIDQKLDSLSADFQSKLKYDSHKNRMIDALHSELLEYKEGFFRNCQLPIIMEIIRLADDIRKFTTHYQTRGLEPSDFSGVMKYLEKLPADLEDLFSWHGVAPFICQGKEFDPRRQRVMKTIETQDLSKDKTIAESLHPGYEREGKVIRPEMVSVYVYAQP
ncbi:MAG: nucleotide exchange factor GrpE [Eubacteriales bacterium]|nr:nucleotide exchange factor GrpE [Eubacteriales bacterium]MDD3082550.1 nucleotide exchange factor GrpE [Desulfobacterales bacterium]